MARRVPASLLKRLEKVEQRRKAKRPLADFPAIMGIDEWEAEAVASQEALTLATQEFIHKGAGAHQWPKAPAENTQAEHERLYREYRKQVEAGPREYLAHKREQIRKATSKTPTG